MTRRRIWDSEGPDWLEPASEGPDYVQNDQMQNNQPQEQIQKYQM